MINIVGIGACVMDTLVSVPRYPEEDTKLRADGTRLAGGGPTATGLVAAAKLGQSCGFIGVLSDDNGGKFPLLFHAEHGGRIYDQTKLKDCTVIPGTDGWKVIVNLNPDDYSARRPLRFEVMRLTDNYQTRYSWPEKKVYRPGRLNLIFHQPCNMGILEE